MPISTDEPITLPIVGVVYRVTVESPDHQTFEFDSWSNGNPYAAALAVYTSHPSGSARLEEQWVRRSERHTLIERGYFGGGEEAEASETARD